MRTLLGAISACTIAWCAQMLAGLRVAPVHNCKHVRLWCAAAIAAESVAMALPSLRFVSRGAAFVSRKALLVAQVEAPCLVTMCHTASCILNHAHFLRLAIVSDYTCEPGSVLVWSLRLKLAQIYAQAFLVGVRAPCMQNGTWISAMCQSFFATRAFVPPAAACELAAHAFVAFFALAACLLVCPRVALPLAAAHVLLAIVFDKLLLTQLCMLMLLLSCRVSAALPGAPGGAFLLAQLTQCWPRGTMIGDASAHVLQSTAVALNLNDTAVYAQSIYARCMVTVVATPADECDAWTTFLCCRALVDVAEAKSFAVYPFVREKFPDAHQIVTKYLTARHVLTQKVAIIKGSLTKE